MPSLHGHYLDVPLGLQPQVSGFKQETQEVSLPVVSTRDDSLYRSKAAKPPVPEPPVLTTASRNKRWKGPSLLDLGLCLGYEHAGAQLKEHLFSMEERNGLSCKDKVFPHY